MKKQLEIKQQYLLIPVKMDQPVTTVTFWQDENKIYEFEIPAAQFGEEYTYDFQSALPVKNWIGKQIIIEGDVPVSFMEAIVQAEEEPKSSDRKPLLHLAANTGWINDPCGLLYDKGIYHLYFQHNPFGTEWGNMSWGHAVSKDLLHWEQQEEALWPDEDGTIFTGSALINQQGLFGLSDEAQLYIYTSAGNSSKWSAGKKFVQKLAWSTDGGCTLNKVPGYILDHIEADNRDMKVYWHEEKQVYFAVMYLDKNDYAILNSPDLKNWTITQKLDLSPAWECPNLFQLKTEDDKTKWVFWTADGFYFIGDFDGSVFTYDETGKCAYRSMLPYAAQTFNGTDRVISIPWMRTNNPGKVRRGMMGIPRQLTLAVQDGEYILRQKLVNEYEQNKAQVLAAHLKEEKQDAVVYTQQEEAVVELVLYPEPKTDFEADIYGTHITWCDGTLKIDGIAARSNGVKDAVKLWDKEEVTEVGQDYRILKPAVCPKKISLLSDGEILEVTLDDGLMSDAFETSADEKKGNIQVKSTGNLKLEIYQSK